MRFAFPALNLKAKLILLMMVLLTLTLGAEVIVSLSAEEAIIRTTQSKVTDLASVIQISVQELTSVEATDHDRLQNYVARLKTQGLEVSIASDKDLIINSSNPKLIGEAVNPEVVRTLMSLRAGGAHNEPIAVPAAKLGLPGEQSTVYFIPVEVEDHLLGYVQVLANFGDFEQPLKAYQFWLVMIALGIFAVGLVFAYLLAERYVKPIHTVAYAAQNIPSHGLEPVPESRRRDEIGLLTRSFNEMIAQLRRAREREAELNRLERFTALGQLAGALAHEIKNPLNFISLAVDQLRTRYGPQLTRGREEFLRQLAMMKDEIKRLSEMVQTFLHYGQPIEVFPAPTDLRQLVNSVLTLSESKLKSQGIEVIEEGTEVESILNVDAEKVRTCFINVIANATQAMPEGGQLRNEFARNDGHFIVRFSDTGLGIDPEIAAHVFEPFYTTKREGIGLGLFFSKAIVEKHGGTVTISPNDPPPGANVTFTFPAGGNRKSV
jgi:signal transduction histidine kinase